jgi:hypothetical protein
MVPPYLSYYSVKRTLQFGDHPVDFMKESKWSPARKHRMNATVTSSSEILMENGASMDIRREGR